MHSFIEVILEFWIPSYYQGEDLSYLSMDYYTTYCSNVMSSKSRVSKLRERNSELHEREQRNGTRATKRNETKMEDERKLKL